MATAVLRIVLFRDRSDFYIETRMQVLLTQLSYEALVVLHLGSLERRADLSTVEGIRRHAQGRTGEWLFGKSGPRRHRLGNYLNVVDGLICSQLIRDLAVFVFDSNIG